MEASEASCKGGGVRGDIRKDAKEELLALRWKREERSNELARARAHANTTQYGQLALPVAIALLVLTFLH